MLCFYENSRNQYRVFKLKFFSLLFSVYFFCVHYFSLALLTIIRTTKRQRTHLNKDSNINKIIYFVIMKSWQKWRYDAILNFPKNCIISSYLGVTVSSCNIKDNFCFTYAHKTQTSLWWCWLIWLSGTFRSEKLTGLVKRLFSVGKETLS